MGKIFGIILKSLKKLSFYKREISIRRKTNFSIFILVVILVGCSYSIEGNLNKTTVKRGNQTVKVEKDVRQEIKAKVDNLNDYKIVDIKHLTKGIDELKVFEPEYPKEFNAGKFKILFQKGNDMKTIICQTEEKVGHLSKIIPGKTVIDGHIFFYNGNIDEIDKEKGGIKFTKAEEKYFIEHVYNRFSQKMTKEQATNFNLIKDFALAIYFNGEKGINEFHKQQIENLIQTS